MAAATLPALAALPGRKLITRQQYDRMINAGVFHGERCELIDGELIEKMGQKPQHALVVSIIGAWLHEVFSRLVRIQLPIEIADSDRELNLPEPDLAVTSQPITAYHSRHPRGDELLLVVEVADSSVAHDLMRKRDIYANAGVPEYWVADVSAHRLTVHTDLAQGIYRTIHTLTPEDTIAPQSRSQSTVRVADLLGLAY